MAQYRVAILDASDKVPLTLLPDGIGGGASFTEDPNNPGLYILTANGSGGSGSYPVASETLAGIVELATNAEATTGTDDTRAVSPKSLKAVADTKAALLHTHSYNDLTDKPASGSAVPATDSVAGIVELATNAEALTGTDTVRATTPANLKAVADTKAALVHTHSYNDLTDKLTTATETTSGIVRFASSTEATTGTETARAVTPVGLKAVGDTKAPLSHTHTATQVSGLATVATSGSYADLGNKPTIPTVVAATDTASGIVELATNAEALTGTDTVRAVTPAGVKAVADTKVSGTARITVGTAAPSSPAVGDLWVDTN